MHLNFVENLHECVRLMNIAMDVHWKNGEKESSCSCMEILIPEDCLRKKIDIVEKWSKEHPVKTMAMDFFEKFPNAPKSDVGTPKMCPCDCGYEVVSRCPDNIMCNSLKCWNRPLKEE